MTLLTSELWAIVYNRRLLTSYRRDAYRKIKERATIAGDPYPGNDALDKELDT